MATPKHLRKAPIKEALIDVRIEPITAVPADTFRALTTVLADGYPVAKDLGAAHATIQIQGGTRVITEVEQLGIQGVRLDSADGKTVVQFRADGFTLNRLKPYQDWRTLWEEAKRLWPVYVAHLHPATVTRLALRYINELQLPLEPEEDFDLYLTAPPNVPTNLPQQLSEFAIRVHLHGPSNLHALVTQRFKSVERPVKVLLDIDAYRVGQFSVDADTIEPVFAQLHDFKNSIFFSYITERTVRLYE